MEKILKIGLLDDEEHPRTLISDVIESIPGYEIAFSSASPFEALELIRQNLIDILITDIKMPGFSGLELSRKILHLDVPVIICSAHGDFGVESFKVNAVYYILKPPSFFEVSIALDKARLALRGNKSVSYQPMEDLILFKESGDFKQVFVKPADISYIEQKAEMTWIFLDSGEVVKTRSRLYNTLEKVQRPFIVKIHRSYAVNYLKIKSLDPAFCHFQNGVRVPIGKEFRQDFAQFLRSKTLT
ncbi:LytTR family DNA-binding domain-containing protein [Algoriphagus jejuensis]|uniref:LytTR family DNA-binding domain-containing protein n=1 Tax=Algoriphagus jejuensis TaxID=419934 RepID=A0ABN1N086_9BACT